MIRKALTTVGVLIAALGLTSKYPQLANWDAFVENAVVVIGAIMWIASFIMSFRKAKNETKA
jgi:hypothetical protein